MPSKPGHISSDRARELVALRTVNSGGRNGGRPPVLKTCAKCGATLPAREFRRHRCA